MSNWRIVHVTPERPGWAERLYDAWGDEDRPTSAELASDEREWDPDAERVRVKAALNIWRHLSLHERSPSNAARLMAWALDGEGFDVCPDCEGSGVDRSVYDYELCPLCRGKGR